MKNNLLSKIYTILIVIYVPLSIYSTGINGISIADLLLLILSVMLIIDTIRKKKLKIFIPFFVFSIYLIINLFFLDMNIENILKTCRFLYYLLVVSIFSSKYFNFELGIKVYKYVSIFAVFYIIIQFTLMKTIGYYLPGYIPFLKINRTELVEFSSSIYSKAQLRVRSIFTEPSQFAEYVAVCLACILLIKNNEKNKLPVAIFLTLGLIISTSSTGIILAAVVWTIYFFSKLKTKITKKKLILFLTILIIAAIYLKNSSAFSTFIERINTGYSQDNRFNGYELILNEVSSNNINILFGAGMNSYDEYLAGWARMIYYFGIIGTLIYIVSLLILINKNKETRIIGLIALLMGTTSAALLGDKSLLLLSIIIALRNNTVHSCENEKIDEVVLC